MSDDEQLFRRPRTRGDCARGIRPCPWVSCAWHIAELRRDDRGRLHLSVLGAHDELAPDASADEIEAWTERASDALLSMEHTCSLDVADRDGCTLEEVGAAMGVTRERIRQIEKKSLPRARGALRKKLHLRSMEDS